jgi:hypothetical protein
MSIDELWVGQNLPGYRGEQLGAYINSNQSRAEENRGVTGVRHLPGALMDEIIDNKFFLKSDISRRKLAECLGVGEGALMDALWSWNKQKMEFALYLQGRFQAKYNRSFAALFAADAVLDPEAIAFIRDTKLSNGGSIKNLHGLRPFWLRWKRFAEGGGCLLPVDWDILAWLLYPKTGPNTKAIVRSSRPAWSGACRQPPGSTPGPQRSSTQLESDDQRAAVAAPVTRAPELVTQAEALGSSSGSAGWRSSSSESDDLDERAGAASSTRARAARCIGAREHAPRPKRICCCIAAAALTVERHSGGSPLLPESGCRRRFWPPPVFLPQP